jgi:hypothetical protein
MHIEHIQYESLGSKVVCAADKIHNLLSLEEDLKIQGEEVWNKFNAVKSDVCWYYRCMLNSILHGYEDRNIPIFNELKAVVNRVILENFVG